MLYENNWDSINSRPIPKWFEDAKFGIFIHWGLYSIPAYAPKNNYSEWYWFNIMQEEPNDTQKLYVDFHNRIYGKNFRYEDFAGLFKAELFDADEWAGLFEASGAKYINFVSKHHDGFCMYKTDYAWNWNSADVGPHRDFCAELSDAMSKTDVRFGVYHSLYEWYNPLYLKSPDEYAVKHLIPMLKELVEKYRPSTLFTDGEWSHPSSVWRSTEFLKWLYNESSVKDFIVPNDRWGSDTRGRLGGNFTTEYGHIGGDLEKQADDRVSEECRGIGGSFGFNRIETPADYLSAAELIWMLVDLVSRGDNLLLNIGPTADGRIPVIMQERLLALGGWLSTNGEGIYSGRKFAQSSDGDIRYTRSGGSVYAFLRRFPFGNVKLPEIDYNKNMNATLLGCDARLTVSDENGKASVGFPPICPDDIKSSYVYVIKLDKALEESK
ncbi:MAG: alpha-L-fucosidase [Clostridiales bacterium]|jgi:alpha-L-fucosidase|nr:alpha-L-fucosidase [Clostridiales bacterium]